MKGKLNTITDPGSAALLPAIDLFNAKAVRLLQGDYNKMTVYNEDALNQALKFKADGAQWLHLVDLEGAKSGTTPNFEVIKKIKHESNLLCEVGGGVRDINIVEKYLSAGIDRVILGTAAVTDENFVIEAVKNFGADKIAVGVDVKDNLVAVKGWTEQVNIKFHEFLIKMRDLGVKTFICTDISRDGALKGANLEFYKNILDLDLNINLIASGGVSSLDDVKALASLNIYGIIIGKALYTGAIDLKQAIEAVK